MERVYPLFTNISVFKAVGQLEKDNILAASDILGLDNEMQEHGLDIIYWAISVWLLKNEFDVPELYLDKYNKINKKHLKNLEKRILTVRSSPLPCKFEIYSIGQSTLGNSVVPENWLGRIFLNGNELHQEMDKLDWRKGKSPVHFCCIYGMAVEDMHVWQSIDKFNKQFDSNLVIQLGYNGKQLITKISKENIPKNYKLYSYKKNMAFAIDYESLVDTNPVYERYETIGILVSRLQKCLRRGRKCPKTLIETVIRLSNSPPYNLPDQQFLKVSGSRQLCWRLFISIVEDCEPYLPNPTYFSLRDIFFLSLLCQADPDIKLRKEIIDKLVYTALLCQHNDKYGTNWKWRDGNIQIQDEQTCYTMALKYMPMMKGDRLMLSKASNFIKKYKLKKLIALPYNNLMSYSDDDVEYDSIVASYDMHCLPNIILELQGSFPFDFFGKGFTTKTIPHLIWENVSRYNVRYGVDKNKLYIPKWLKNGKKEISTFRNILQEIQEYNFRKEYNIPNEFKNNIKKFVNDGYNNEYKTFPFKAGKQAFLTIYGQKVKLNREGVNCALEIVVGGDLLDGEICKVKKVSSDKYLNGVEQSNGQNRYIKYMKKNNKIMVDLGDAPENYEWIDKIRNKKKVHIYIDNGEFHVENIKLKLFDARKILIKINKIQVFETPKIYKNIICQTLHCKTPKIYKPYEINLLNRAIHKLRRKRKDHKVYEWIYFKDLSSVKSDIWRLILVRLHNGFDNEIFVGPVDRQGKKINRSINYIYEGLLWRIINMLAALYPACIRIRGFFKWTLNKNAYEYTHLKECLNKLCFNKISIIKPNKTFIKIKTKLWAHQMKTVNRIFHGYTIECKKGFGDASFVGAGKTLTALTVISKLMNYKSSSFKGAVVLLPTTKLYKTWFNEINKHTKGYNILVQQANGAILSLNNHLLGKKQNKYEITEHTLLITTLGRMRNHPISHPWIITVIDECLTVQNKDALQTFEAWRQAMCSEYGVLMMSATFFRSRFDKMFYMLSMLRSGLPERKEYLDAILAEHIVCCIPENERIWHETITKYELSYADMKQYNKIKQQEMTSEKKYQALSKFIHTQINYELLFSKRVNELKNKKILIYCKGKGEADRLSQINESISRYPDKSKKHVVVSYAEGTYGLNDLVGYDTLLTRPPEPDKLPQMKGRLDRPGQKANILNLEYILLKNTIEEAWLYRLELCSNFYKNHILRLAEFYDLAVK